MKKKKQIIITQKNCILGKPGTILSVANGYALNYLIPNKIAEILTTGKLKHANMLKDIENKHLEANKTQAILKQKNLEQISKINIKKKVGENQQIFGSVNEKEVIAAIINYAGLKLEKKQIEIPDIKYIGIYIVQINITKDIRVNLKLQVIPDHI